MGEIVVVAMNIAEALVMLLAAFKIFNKVVADAEARCRLNTADFNATDMKSGGQNRGGHRLSSFLIFVLTQLLFVTVFSSPVRLPTTSSRTVTLWNCLRVLVFPKKTPADWPVFVIVIVPKVSCIEGDPL